MVGSSRIRWLIILNCMVLPCATAGAQKQPTPSDLARGGTLPDAWEFDVASIRPSGNPGRRTRVMRHPNDAEFVAQNASLHTLLEIAYGVSEPRVIGLPSSLESARFDVQAKGDVETDARFRTLNSGQMRIAKQQMLQALLADRFRLKVHFETRELPVFDLVVARGGPKLLSSDQVNASARGWRNHLDVEGGDTLTRFAEELTRVAGRPVLNQTGLTGRYDMEMDWADDDDDEDVDTPKLLTAIREQFGLALKPDKAQVQVVVVEHMELPSEN